MDRFAHNKIIAYQFSARARIFAFIFSVIAATLFIVWMASAANTTIGSNITTSGNLTVGGSSSLASVILSGSFNASSTAQVTGTTTLYGYLGIGASNPEFRLHIKDSSEESANRVMLLEYVYSATSTFGFATRKARGTLASKSAAALGDDVMSLTGEYYDGSNYNTAGEIVMKADDLGTIALGSTPGNIQFYTTPSGSTDTQLRMIIRHNGNVGIGTSSPSQLLSVNGSGLFSGNLSLANLTATGTLTLSSGTPLNFTSSATSTIPNNLINAWSIATSTSVRPLISFMTSSSTGNALTGAGGEFGGQGRVGIGTANPITQLEVVDEDPNGTGISATNYGGSASFPTFTGLGARGTKASPTASQANDVLVILGGRGFDSSQFSAATKGRITIRASENWSATNQGAYLTFDTTQSGGTTRTEKMRITDAGNVGIGTTSPWGLLSVNPNGIGAGPAFVVGSSTATHLIVTNGGGVGIGTSTPTSKLSIEGTCIDTGGGCADYAELYPSSEPVEPGDILALDPNNPGKVKKARQSNVSGQMSDAVIIGAVSSNPAIIIEGSALQLMSGSNYKSSPDKPAVALAGKIPVKVNLEGGEIKIGDPITASTELGVGKNARSTRASTELSRMSSGQATKIIGYALENYPNESNASGQMSNVGKIMMFVNNTYYVENSKSESLKSTLDIMTDDLVAIIKSWLEGMKVFVSDGLVKVEDLAAEIITVNKLKTKFMEMEDVVTGQIYCISIVNGQLQNAPGNCN